MRRGGRRVKRTPRKPGRGLYGIQIGFASQEDAERFLANAGEIAVVRDASGMDVSWMVKALRRSAKTFCLLR